MATEFKSGPVRLSEFELHRRRARRIYRAQVACFLIGLLAVSFMVIYAVSLLLRMFRGGGGL